jgi:tetratricopeptide (TPR) repeat protein
MGPTNSRKETLVLRIYSILILIYAVFDIIVNILPKTLSISIIPNAAFLNYFFILTSLSLYLTPINMIVGYGLLRKRYWARYGVIAAMLTFPVSIFIQYLYTGYHGFHLHDISVQLFFVVITLLYFSKKKVRALFGEPRSFRLTSWHGVLVIVIVLFSFWWIIFSLYWKVHAARKFGYPFFTDKPQITALEKPYNPERLPNYREVRLLNTSVLIPKEFSIRRLIRTERKSAKWAVSLQNQGMNTKGFIAFGNSPPYDEFFPQEQITELLGNISKFETEKYILTNDWNPGLVVIRSLMKPKGGEGFNIKEFHMNGLKGFLKGWQRGDASFREFSVYNREDTQCVSGTMMSVKGYLDETDVLTILSSIEFLKPEGSSQSEGHYQNGLRFYKKGDILQSQVEFANAYVLSPENPDYIFMFAKSLFLKDQKFLDYTHIKELLNKALKLKPDHKEARKLLKEVESNLPKAPKSS